MSESMNIRSEKKDSITANRNVKGEYAWEIKVYYDCETESVHDVINNLVYTDMKLKEKFL